MDITRIISDLLLRDSSVSIPGLGTFSVLHIPSEIYRYSNLISPPSYKIDYTENFDAANNSLAYILSEEYDMPSIKAKEIISNWVNEVKSLLKNGKSFSIKNIGILNEVSGKIIFEADLNSLLTAGSYGLESIKTSLIELETEKPETYTPINLQSKLKKPVYILKWAAILVSVIILFSAGFIAYNMGYLDKTIMDLSEIFIFSDQNENHQLATNDTLSGKIDAYKLKRNALNYNEFQKAQKAISDKKQQSLQKQKTLKYYIIAGSFRSFKSANRFKSELIMYGYSPEILNIGDTTFRVSLNSFSNRKKAVEEYIMITTKDTKRKIWLYSQLVEE